MSKAKVVTLFRMVLFEAADGWLGGGGKKASLTQ